MCRVVAPASDRTLHACMCICAVVYPCMVVSLLHSPHFSLSLTFSFSYSLFLSLSLTLSLPTGMVPEADGRNGLPRRFTAPALRARHGISPRDDSRRYRANRGCEEGMNANAASDHSRTTFVNWLRDFTVVG